MDSIVVFVLFDTLKLHSLVEYKLFDFSDEPRKD